jgi:hypothetical protein
MVLIAAGGIPALLAMAHDGNDANDERRAATEVLFSLIKQEEDDGKSRELIVAAGGVEVLVSVAESRGFGVGSRFPNIRLGDVSEDQERANARRHSAASCMVELTITGHGAAVAAASGIPIMLPLIRIDEVEHTCYGARAFEIMSRHEECLTAIVEAGAIPLLVAAGREPCVTGRYNVAIILMNLAQNRGMRGDGGRGKMIAAAGGVPMLKNLAQEEEDSGQDGPLGKALGEYARLALKSMAENVELRASLTPFFKDEDEDGDDKGGGSDDTTDTNGPCDRCGKDEAPSQCPKCGTGYCDEVCQHKGWKQHKKVCAARANERQEERDAKVASDLSSALDTALVFGESGGDNSGPVSQDTERAMTKRMLNEVARQVLRDAPKIVRVRGKGGKGGKGGAGGKGGKGGKGGAGGKGQAGNSGQAQLI